MTRMVMCRKYKKELPGLDRPPYPGPKGQAVFNEVSRKAWDEWQKHQTRQRCRETRRGRHKGRAVVSTTSLVQWCRASDRAAS